MFGWKKFAPFFIQSEVNSQLIASHSKKFSLVLHHHHVITFGLDWCIGFSASFIISLRTGSRLGFKDEGGAENSLVTRGWTWEAPFRLDPHSLRSQSFAPNASLPDFSSFSFARGFFSTLVGAFWQLDQQPARAIDPWPLRAKGLIVSVVSPN